MGRACNLTGAVATANERLADRFNSVFGPRRSPSVRVEDEAASGLTVTVQLVGLSNEDGHTSNCDVEVAAPNPREDFAEWWENIVFPETGDGSGGDMDTYYTATIVRADDPQLVGLSNEWM